MTSIPCSTISDNIKTEANNLPQSTVIAKTSGRKWNTFFTAKNITVITLLGFNVLLAYKCYNQQKELIYKDYLNRLPVDTCKSLFLHQNQLFQEYLVYSEKSDNLINKIFRRNDQTTKHLDIINDL